MKRSALAISVVLILLTSDLSAAIAPTIYVDGDATGANNGASWSDAYTNLQTVLSSSVSNDNIWVAEGTYKPGTARTDTFNLKAGVQLYGGFSGTETNLNQRDWTNHVTVLSGEIGTSSATDNIYRVVSVQTNCHAVILDGLTITRGYYTNDTLGKGAGLYVCKANGTQVRNCLFFDNYARYLGGGLYFQPEPASPTRNITIQNCRFVSNRTDKTSSGGGGVALEKSIAVFQDCSFIQNTTAGNGGGLYGVSQAIVTMRDCELQNNEAQYGGGAYLYPNASPIAVEDCWFEENTASYYGGGLYINSAPSTGQVSRCAFFGNYADRDGGGVFNNSGDLLFENCLFSGNNGAGIGTTGGGGLVNYNGAKPRLINCTFSANEGKNGGGMANLGSGGVWVGLTNSIFWGNTATNNGQQIYQNVTGILRAAYSDIQDGTNGIYLTGNASLVWGSGMMASNPYFKSSAGPDDIPGTWDDDLRLTITSPCVDTATSDGAPSNDIEWISRPQKSGFDLGAHELEVDSDHDGLPDDWEMQYFYDLDEMAEGDPDDDGLSNLQEFQIGTKPAYSDSDYDGAADGLEVLIGTDPLDPNSLPVNLSGAVTYEGRQTGTIWVVAVDDAESWSTNRSGAIFFATVVITNSMPFPDGEQVLTNSYVDMARAEYVISNVPSGTRWIKAFRDSNENGVPDASEAFGVYEFNPVVLSNDMGGIEMSLTDLDSDGDGMPDWWELQYGLNVFTNDGALDPDGDGLPNYQEYVFENGPTNYDGQTGYSGPPVTNLWIAQFGRVWTTNNPGATGYVAVTVVYASSFTNDIEVFTCNDLAASNWTSVTTVATNPATNWVLWVDEEATNMAIATRFYAVGNADYDWDCDGVPDAHEILVDHTPVADLDSDGDGLCNRLEVQYGSSPTNADTDFDGMGDGAEVDNMQNPAISNSYSTLPFVEHFDVLQYAELRGEAGITNFGTSVAMCSNRMIVGSYDYTHRSNGRAFIFAWDGTNWTKEATLTAWAGSTNDRFGISVDMIDNQAVVGADNDNNQGAVYVFGRSGTNWSNDSKILSPVTPDDSFGFAVAISTNGIVAGACLSYGGDKLEGGTAYFYEQQGTNWVRRQDIAAPDPGTYHNFGYAIDIDNNSLVIGTPGDYGGGSVHAFSWTGSNWLHEAKLTPLASDGLDNSSMGHSVQLSDDLLVAGAPYHGISARYQRGAAFIFRKSGTNWIREAKLHASEWARFDQFGKSIAVSDGIVMIGVPGDDDEGTDAGMVRVFVQSGTNWIEQTKTWPADFTGYDRLGYSMASMGSLFAVGAPWKEDEGAGAGAVYVFSSSNIIGNRALPPNTPINGFRNWQTWPAELPTVQSNVFCEGNGSLKIPESFSDTTVCHLLAAHGQTSVWVDLWAQFDPSNSTFSSEYPEITDLPQGLPSAFAVNADGHLVAYDGLDGSWLTVTGVVVSATTFHRYTVRQEYVAKIWDLYFDGNRVLSNLGFTDTNTVEFSCFQFTRKSNGSGDTYLDSLSIGTSRPSGLTD